jgi:class 3 adenylate cyclase
MATAGRREVLVTASAYEAAAGATIRFSPAGQHRLKGLSEARQLYRVERPVHSQARDP